MGSVAELVEEWAHWRSEVISEKQWRRWYTKRGHRLDCDLIESVDARLKRFLAMQRECEKKLGFRPRMREWLRGTYTPTEATP